MSLSAQQTQHNPLAEEDLWRQRLVAELSSILDEGISRLRANPDRTMAYMERGAQAIMREISGPMLDQLAERVDDELPRPGCCGASMEITNRRPREILSLVAANRPRRREYRCAGCGRTVIPADEVLGLGPGKYSPELTRVVSANGAEIASFERATILVAETLGLSDLHVSTLTRTCQAIGASVEAGEQAARAALKLQSTVAEVPEAPIAAAEPSLLLGVDATKAHADGKWRDVKVAVAATLAPGDVPPPDAQGTGTPQAPTAVPEAAPPDLVMGPRSFAAAIEDADHFLLRAIVLLGQLGWLPGQPAVILLLGDGGPWIWAYAARLRALGLQVIEVLDLYHAREHIWKVAHAVLGTGIAAHHWGDKVAAALKAEGPQPVLEALRKLRPRGRNQKAEVRKAIDYFETNAGRMHYPEYAARGLPLGSGIVESACRLVSGLRVKQPGMRWTLGGVQAILSLRALRLGPESVWSDFWRSCPLRRRPPVASLHRPVVHAA